MKFLPPSLASLCLLCCSLHAADSGAASVDAAVKVPVAPVKKEPAKLSVPPTEADVAYGTHRKQVLHFWRAVSEKPTPVLFFIHGGGWRGGDRTSVNSLLKPALEKGISVVSVEYRFVQESSDQEPPVKGPLSDAARALQFVRSKAAQWNLDKSRIGASGGSAGACSSLWLAFHDDMAEPNSTDPVARESTRLTCAAVSGAQTTLDPQQMREWTPNSKYGAHAFGITGTFEVFLAEREKILPWIALYSPYALVSAGDPPVGLYYGAPPAMGQDQKDPTHSANFGVGLKARCDALKVPCELVYPGAPSVKHAGIFDFLVAHLQPAQ